MSRKLGMEVISLPGLRFVFSLSPEFLPHGRRNPTAEE